MTKSILIDFEKIKDPFCGLGQFCANLKTYFDQDKSGIRYFIPNKFEKLAKKIPFLLPKTDVFHAIHQDSPFLPWSAKTKYILTIHDLNALYENTNPFFQETYKEKLQKKISRASAVTFISDFARQEVIRNFSIDPKKTKVIYNGVSLGKKSLAPQFVPQCKFLFSIGTVLPKKNFHVLIDFLKITPGYSIVLAGTTFHQYATDMKEKIKAEGLENRLHLIGTINEEEKLWYYQNASAFLFPSLLEGFGLPVVEAMSLGLPLFLSNKTSLPEIGGSDAYYFDDFTPEKMREVFLKGMENFNEEKKRRLMARASQFSWEKAAHEYLTLYKTI